MAKAKTVNEYQQFTVGSLIKCLETIVKDPEWNVDYNTKICLSDFECNGLQTQMEVMMAEDRPELFFWYEMHEGEWY